MYASRPIATGLPKENSASQFFTSLYNHIKDKEKHRISTKSFLEKKTKLTCVFPSRYKDDHSRKGNCHKEN